MLVSRSCSRSLAVAWSRSRSASSSRMRRSVITRASVSESALDADLSKIRARSAHHNAPRPVQSRRGDGGALRGLAPVRSDEGNDQPVGAARAPVLDHRASSTPDMCRHPGYSPPQNRTQARGASNLEAVYSRSNGAGRVHSTRRRPPPPAKTHAPADPGSTSRSKGREMNGLGALAAFQPSHRRARGSTRSVCRRRLESAPWHAHAI